MTVPTLDELIGALDAIDPDDIDGKHAAFVRTITLYPNSEAHKWAAAERAKGRPERELTWGNCIEGILLKDNTTGRS